MFQEYILVYSAINEVLLAVILTLTGRYNNINVGASFWHDALKIDVKSNYFSCNKTPRSAGKTSLDLANSESSSALRALYEQVESSAPA